MGIVEHSYNPSTQEAMARESQVKTRLVQALSQNKTENKDKKATTQTKMIFNINRENRPFVFFYNSSHFYGSELHM